MSLVSVYYLVKRNRFYFCIIFLDLLPLLGAFFCDSTNSQRSLTTQSPHFPATR